MKYSSYILTGTILLGLLAPASAEENVIDLTEQFSGTPENERLHYYEEIDLKPAYEEFGLSGDGIRITIMGEMVDAQHPEINQAIVKQYNAFAKRGEILPGEGNQVFRPEMLTNGDGHGTHIAGTIAAACDGQGIMGVACGASIDVYALGAYDNSDDFRVDEPTEDEEMTGFIDAFANAMIDVTQRGESKIITGSFNLEGPAILFGDHNPVSPAEIIDVVDASGFSLKQNLNSPLFESASEQDIAMLERVIRANGKDMSIAAFALMPRTESFRHMADTISDYQNSGGVYIVTESNYLFEDRTSVLNALPTLFDNVDPDLWLSVVMVNPEGFFEAETEEELKAVKNNDYVSVLNTCGTMAKDYCIVVPSYGVLSTMTERVSEEGLPILMMDGMRYQTFTGHSMGAPMVAGALALMQEYNQRENLGLSMKDLVRILKQSADRSFKGFDPIKHGQGMLDVAAAIRQMKN